MNFNQKNKVAIVSGASKGIGLSIKKSLEKEGSIVFGLSRSPSSNEYDKKCDIRNEDDIKECIDEIISKFGRIDILVNNAGIFSKGPLINSNINTWNDVISTNLTGAFLLCKHVLPYMQQKKYGKIVNVSSIAARSYSKKGSVEYTVSKYGLIGLTRQLSYEYGSQNININCICPSQTNTEMLIANLKSEDIEKMEENIPLGKIADPNQIAEVAVFLCSEKSNYMQGAVLDINGGQI